MSFITAIYNVFVVIFIVIHLLVGGIVSIVQVPHINTIGSLYDDLYRHSFPCFSHAHMFDTLYTFKPFKKFCCKLVVSSFQLTFGAGVYAGVYLSQNYEVSYKFKPQYVLEIARC